MKVPSLTIMVLLLLTTGTGFGQENILGVPYIKNGEGNSGHHVRGYGLGRVGFGLVESIPRLCASLTIDVEVAEGLSLGLGFGYNEYGDMYVLPYKYMYVFPLFADFRLDFVRGSASPFIFADVGYSNEKVKGDPDLYGAGLMINAGVGFRVSISEKSPLILEMGYKSQQIRQMHYDLGWRIPSLTRQTNLQFFALTIGVHIF